MAPIDADTGETVTRTVRPKLESDDHDSPAILVAPDGHLTVFYSKHNGPDLFYRTSIESESVQHWGPEQTVSTNTRGRSRSYGYT